LRFGIKLTLIPIFVAAIFATFGFTHDAKSSDHDLFLFDLCLNYHSAGDNSALERSNNQNASFDSGQNEYSLPIDQFFVPDTNISKSDTLTSDTTKLKPLTADSTYTKTQKDSSRIIPDLTDSTNRFNNLAVPDTNKGRTDPVIDTNKTKMSRADSIRFREKQDSLKRIDSLSADSTARIKYFRAHRDDYHVVPFRTKKPSAFFVQPSSSRITRSVELDSTGTKVIIKELIAGQQTKTLLEIPLDEYIKMRLEAISRDEWEKLGYAYTLKEDKQDLSQLITSLTNIQIPLPSTPLLSIFGKPGINLKISGAVDIHGAWRNETTEGVTTSALGNTRNEPDFKQQVQINLSGTIGDKLNISADWNTERQFQYENQLKIKYTGYEDEIVQNVEAGNVSLQTSPLVGGSEALFGVKAQFQMGAFNLTALASQKKSEVQEVSVSGGAKSQKFEIHAYDYSPNHFFLDKLYADPVRNIFNNYFGNPTPRADASVYVKEIEVWKSFSALITGQQRKANAFIDLP